MADDVALMAAHHDPHGCQGQVFLKKNAGITQENVINAFWDVIAAKGFEKDMFFQEATTAIRALPKLEGTVHVNIALIVKFMANYLFNPKAYPPVPTRSEPANDAFLFNQGSTKGLSSIQFHDYKEAFASAQAPNVRVFEQQIDAFKALLVQAPLSEAQTQDIDFLLTVGHIFTQIVYGQLVLERAKQVMLSSDVVDQIFDVFVRDTNQCATTLAMKASSTADQEGLALKIVKRPVHDAARYDRVWEQHVYPWHAVG